MADPESTRKPLDPGSGDSPTVTVSRDTPLRTRSRQAKLVRSAAALRTPHPGRTSPLGGHHSPATGCSTPVRGAPGSRWSAPVSPCQDSALSVAASQSTLLNRPRARLRRGRSRKSPIPGKPYRQRENAGCRELGRGMTARGRGDVGQALVGGPSAWRDEVWRARFRKGPRELAAGLVSRRRTVRPSPTAPDSGGTPPTPGEGAPTQAQKLFRGPDGSLLLGRPSSR